MKDEEFMKIALKEANIAYKHNEVPIGACLVKDNKIIAKAHNKKYNCKNALNHAEILVLKKAQKKLKDWHFNDLTLYVTLEPCPMCAGAIINFRVGRVVFGTTDDRFGAVGSKINLFEENFNHKPLVTKGVCKEESSNILSNFFKEKREKNKLKN